MTLPTFLGIGVPRAGSSWIAAQLGEHPQVYMAPGKEIFFFNRYYERGLDWYEERFAGATLHHKAIGEFTPEYLFCDECPARMVAVPSITKLILTLRNPVDRLYSHYGLQVRSTTCQRSFEDYLDNKNTLKFGYYSQHLEKYLHYYQPSQICVLIFEQTIANDSALTQHKLARFLEIDQSLFRQGIENKGRNASYIPRRRLGYALYVKVNQFLLKRGHHQTVERIRGWQLQRLFGKQSSLPPMKPHTRRQLEEIYQPEIDRLERLLQLDLSCWQTSADKI